MTATDITCGGPRAHVRHRSFRLDRLRRRPPELIGAGHQVVGLARSDDSVTALSTAGAEVRRGTLDDLDGLRAEAAAADGVIHLAFKHDIAFYGDFDGAVAAERRAIETFGEALAGSDRPLVIAAGTLGLTSGRVATEQDGLSPASSAATRELLGSHPTRRGLIEDLDEGHYFRG